MGYYIPRLQGNTMFVTTIESKQNSKAYETHLVRRTFREKGRVRTETLANITELPAHVFPEVRLSPYRIVVGVSHSGGRPGDHRHGTRPGHR